MILDFKLDPRHDRRALADEFRRSGRLSIGPILDERCAADLHAHLRGRGDWKQVVGNDEKVAELDRPTRDSLSAEQREMLDQAVYAGARGGFQFRYETIRVPDSDAERAASEDPLAAFARWWSEGEAREFLRAITGFPQIEFADAQATAYSPGDFLTGHDDDVEGKNRYAAYVLNLTPQWRTEWGGLLLFHDDAAFRADALAPSFNRLNLFRVPQPHSVSEVTRAAAYRRYAITGWLRG